MQKLFVLIVLFCGIGIHGGLFAGEEGDYYVVESEGMGRNRSEAIDQAWVEAIRSSVGMMTDIRTEVNQDEVSETIIAHSRGLVEKYEILMADDSRAGEGVYRVRLKAWVRKDILRDGLEYVASRGQTIAFSIADLKKKEELDPNQAESLDARQKGKAAQGQEAAKLIVQLLNKYKQSDFVTVTIADKPELVEGQKDKIRIKLDVSFNEDLYYQGFLPEARQLFAQIAEKAQKGYYQDQKAVDDIRKTHGEFVNTDVSVYGKYAEGGFDVILPDVKNSFSYNAYKLTQETLSSLVAASRDIHSYLGRLGFRVVFLNGDNDEIYSFNGNIGLSAFRNNDLRHGKMNKSRLVFYPNLLFAGKGERFKDRVSGVFVMPEEVLPEIAALRLEVLESAGDTAPPDRETEIGLGGDVSIAFRLVPAGTFTMGSPPSELGRANDEVQHQVTLTTPFYLGVYEVTQEQWQAVMGNNPSHFKGGRKPVETVSWHDATEFCRKLSEKTGKKFRLPTEAEWEYACRAGTETAYNAGDGLGENQANYQSRQTREVGSYSPNAWGLYDMHGNVWEWCSDWYGDYPRGSVSDHKGPENGGLRVLRGGSWNNSATLCRSALRRWNDPGRRNDHCGFRIALDP